MVRVVNQVRIRVDAGIGHLVILNHRGDVFTVHQTEIDTGLTQLKTDQFVGPAGFGKTDAVLVSPVNIGQVGVQGLFSLR